ncbi:hypothetical protein CLOM_g3701 [Closterium sp. NIES-68]|nr:hypothetical protein CLOM_g3701 [Closterium sp. NIES-68]
MVEDVHGHEGDVGSVGKVVMHPLTHWVIDSGCTSHMTPQADLLDEVKPPGKIKYVAAASGALLPVIGVGNAKVKGANGELVGLGNVLLVEGLSANLLSVRRLQKSKAEPPERPRRDVRPPVRLTYGGRGKPNVVQAGSVVEQIEEDEIAHCYWAPIPEPKTREEALNGPNGEKWKASEDEEFGSLIENETWDLYS